MFARTMLSGNRRGIIGAATLLLAATVALAMAGDLDEAFGVDGIVDIDRSPDPNWTEVDCAVQSDGKIVLAGGDEIGVPYARWMIKRFNADGSVDSGYGSGGSVTVFGAADGDWLHDIALDSSGRVLAVGMASVVTVTTQGKKTTTTTLLGAGLARITSTGQLDTSFGSGGTVFTPVPGAILSGAKTVTQQPDGKILVAGFATFKGEKVRGSYAQDPAIYLARYLANGSLDTTFGNGGITVHNRTSGGDSAAGIALQSDGKIVVSSATDFGDQWVITRYLANGAIDTGFGTILSTGDRLLGLSTDANDRIVGVGLRVYGSTADMLAVRYTASGALDTSFGSGGEVVLDLDVFEGIRSAPRFQADGKIVCCGIVATDTTTWYDYGVVLRLNDDGTLDDSFGSGGIAGPLQLSSTFTEPWSLDLSPDGGIVVAGRAKEDGDLHWFLARYLFE